MKLLIVEGLDRCGKDTLIASLSTKYKFVVNSHWGFPKGETDEEKTQYQRERFSEEFRMQDIIRYTGRKGYLQDEGIIIWNRSHIGEYVYGNLYRNSQPETWVPKLEDKYFINDPDVYLIYLYADAEFLVKQEDGKSYSTKLEDKQREIERFHAAIDSSKINNKIKIKVNNGDKYTDATSILDVIERALSK